MNIDWKSLAKARGLAIPDAALDLIAPRLDALEELFRPRTLDLTPADEPAAAFRADVEIE